MEMKIKSEMKVFFWSADFLFFVCPFVLFSIFLDIMLSVLLWFTDFDDSFGIFKLFLDIKMECKRFYSDWSYQNLYA